MRLHQLTVTAFGPFRESVEVDFDEVCSAGLFLIHGATGSGKTSLLDAICFALFADVPGARSKKGLASDHAAEGTRPVVTLELSVGSRRFRIERSPEYHRPKKRGTGLLKVQAKVVLEELRDGGWEGVSTRHDEVADLLDDVLGMGLAHFAKVVVLPQGDVAAFLRSSPEERRTLLERLFDVSTFADVEAWLVEERRRTAAAVEDHAAALDRELARLDDLLATDDSPSWRSAALADVPACLATETTRLEEEVSELLAAADQADSALSRASRELHEARTLDAERARGMRARADLERAAGQAEEISDRRARVARAQAADALAGHLAGLDSARNEEAALAAALTEALDHLGERGAQASTDRIADLAAQIHAHDADVADLGRVVADLARAETQVRSCQEALTAAEAEVAATEQARDRASAAVKEAEAAAAPLAEVAATVGAATEADARAERQLAIGVEITALTAAREAAAPTLIAANADLLAAQQSVITLRQRRLDGMAAELASGLDLGDACPVCGSEEHPRPAESSDAATAEEIEAAEEVLLQAQQIQGALERDDAAAAARVTALREQLGADSPPVELLRTRREEAAQSLRAANEARAALAAVESQLADLAATTATAQQTLLAAGTALTTAAARHESAVAVRAEHVAALGEFIAAHALCPCLRDEADLAAAVDHLESEHVATLAAHHRTLAAALDAATSAQARLAESEARTAHCLLLAQEAAAERDFADLDEVRAAVLEPAVVASHQLSIGAHEQLIAVAGATLAEKSVVAALAAEEPDVDAAGQAEAAARSRVRSTQSAHTAADTRLTVLRSVSATVSDLIDSSADLQRRASAVKDLADTATGLGSANSRRMRLSSYVLAARLEKVVALANERLHTMDAGRYLLDHTDARVSGGGRSGLGLQVLDQWTGRLRETASLSGGESFMVSLALALGLADAVREESGGMDLGTLFVDEGFGTLDDDSLEHVMGVLDGLREGGRAVGVVSHVADLRARITHQVVVQKATSGSTVSVQTATTTAA
ncbi:MAG: SMC family ATPase [Actinomycetia bacterium]|nr:SMC family ATPase [Actinomycetes bacterium]